MAKRNQTRWIILIAGLVFIAVLVYATIEQTRLEYEVCLNFKGHTHCATAKGATADEAIRSAHDIDCGLLAGSRDDNIVCTGTSPSSVRQIK
jgi:hypothetical protein